MRRIVSLAALMILLSGCSPALLTAPDGEIPAARAAAPAPTASTLAPSAPAQAPDIQANMVTETFSPSGESFAAIDLTVAGLDALSTSVQVKDTLGMADREEAIQDASGRFQTVWWYQNNQLIFRENRLIEADLTNVAIIGPRGLRVGDTLSMLEKTYGLTGAGDPYYAEENDLPPRAEKLAFPDDPRYTIILTAPVAPYTAEQLAQTRGYMEAPHGQLVYTLDQTNDRIISIHWIVAPLSENAQ